MNKDLNYQISS